MKRDIQLLKNAFSTTAIYALWFSMCSRLCLFNSRKRMEPSGQEKFAQIDVSRPNIWKIVFPQFWISLHSLAFLCDDHKLKFISVLNRQKKVTIRIQKIRRFELYFEVLYISWQNNKIETFNHKQASWKFIAMEMNCYEFAMNFQFVL